MKRLFLILAICLIIALSAIWGYLLFFGAPESTRDFFANFNFGNTEGTTVSEMPPVTNIEAIENLTDPSALRQLTTKPVVGYQEIVSTSTNKTVVYYIEAGTGHIFSLDKDSSAELRLSNITVPGASAGVINASGTQAVIQSGEPGEGELTVITLQGTVDAADSYPIVTGAVSFTLTREGDVLYTLKENDALLGYRFNLQSKVTSNLFTLPFREATLRFANTTTGPHYAYPKADPRLEGYLYQISSNGGVIRLPIDGFGLGVMTNTDTVLFSIQEAGTYSSYLYDTSSKTLQTFGLTTIPDKCAPTNSGKYAFICGATTDAFDPLTPVTWFRGEVTYSDSLWGIFISEGVPTLVAISNLEAESGRVIDVIMPNIFESNNVYFLNRTDRTLWTHEIEIDLN